MSHFTVLVIGENIEEKLEPYDENKEVEPYIKYTKAEIIAERRELSMRRYDLQKYAKMSINQFIEDWHGLEADKDGNALSTYNPQSKYDWYQIGGRWQGKLKLKEGKTGEIGEVSLLIKDHEYEKDKVDRAKFGDIDWEWMRRNEWQYHSTRWYNWEHLDITDKLFEDNIKEVYKNKEEYIKHKTTFHTYAIITEDGKWYSVGDMGWWGMSSESSDEEKDWEINYYDRFLKPLKDKPNTLLTVVDCHI